jgi:hypothetical protein
VAQYHKGSCSLTRKSSTFFGLLCWKEANNSLSRYGRARSSNNKMRAVSRLLILLGTLVLISVQCHATEDVVLQEVDTTQELQGAQSERKLQNYGSATRGNNGNTRRGMGMRGRGKNNNMMRGNGYGYGWRSNSKGKGMGMMSKSRNKSSRR